MQTRVDPFLAAVIHGALENIAIEMGHKLMRMSYSSIIRESEDFGTALTDATGRQLCECAMSTPLQSGPIPGYIEGILRELEARGDAVHPGDVFMHNDAYGGASHGPDVGFAVPIFHHDKLAGFSVTTAHHLDIGASSPGSCGIVDAVDSYAEGLQFKAVRVYDAGKKVEPVWQILRSNIRIADLVVGDMEAQVAAARIGADRYSALLDQYGLETVTGAYEDLLDYSEKLMRDAIAAIPDGSYNARTYIDGYLDSDDPALKDLPIEVTLTVTGSDVLVDLTGTAPQTPNKPINMPLVGTVDCAVWLTLRSILLDSDTYGAIPQNSGLTRPITIHAPEGCLANPIFPAPVIARFCPGNALADTVMKAIAPAVPRQVSAGIGNLRVMAFSGQTKAGPWVHMEIMEGAYGGRYGKDGMDAVDTLYANTRNNPVEDIESHLPLRVLNYELRENVAGAGQWRGGIGSIRSFELLEDGAVSVEGDGQKFRPWGFAGGRDGSPANVDLVHANGQSEALPSKIPYRQIAKGDRLVAYGPCGGGYGDPFTRAPEDVLDDVLDGLLHVDTAREDYGVAILDGCRLDLEATEKLRASR
ncbi:hydantoinase B/oxoprolinase family protein [Antarcticimicrobium sediminis]|uniref:Hydantoinase B/oxoprolinase family protein n=1 Tax=Antarcticimicrobium sediminis TaxID=2546227 RepID=A0A4R5EVL5_9RHOB|nr:hydantoinase B/oxoprolinase family protein [Antarcticimicrobium sediminis]TDE38923.1 hydantoinase B/oxoprolinase family protein [Antarcticimicrobium sediminis]